MAHLMLLEYVLGSIVGFVAVSLLLSANRTVGRSDIRLLAGAILAQNLRVMLFGLAYYQPLHAALLSMHDGRIRALIVLAYYCLVALHGCLMLAWLFARAGWGRLAALLAPYWLYYALAILSKAAPVFGLGLPWDGAAWSNLAFGLGGTLVDKAFIFMSAALFLAKRKNRRYPGKAQETGALLALQAAVIADSVLPRLPLSPLAIFFTMLPFYTFPFLIVAGMRREEEAALPAAPPALQEAPWTPSGGPCLDEEEARLVAAILDGRSNKDIAGTEGLSLSAVKHRLYALYRRLGVSSRFELMALYGRKGGPPP